VINLEQRSVQSLLDDIRLLGPAQIELVEAVRASVKAAIPGVGEAVKYGGILFHADPDRFFCGVFAYKAHVSVEFSQGSKIDDPWGHLEGGGRYRRHLKLTSVADIEDKRLIDYLPLALAAARAAD
jgi:hypothetical protein